MYFNLIYLLAIVLHYNMSTNPSIRKQLSGSAKRKLKQINDEKVNKLRGSMDQFIKKKQTWFLKLVRLLLIIIIPIIFVPSYHCIIFSVNSSSSDLACTNTMTIVSSEYSDATNIAESTGIYLI